jgi:hypothetical protein
VAKGTDIFPYIHLEMAEGKQFRSGSGWRGRAESAACESVGMGRGGGVSTKRQKFRKATRIRSHRIQRKSQTSLRLWRSISLGTKLVNILIDNWVVWLVGGLVILRSSYSRGWLKPK